MVGDGFPVTGVWSLGHRSPCWELDVAAAADFATKVSNEQEGPMVTMGVLGPNTNAHAPNEGINLEYTR